ncbi:MAG: ABC transporter ATP-binding protein [Planctomycetota bacterium]
MPREKLKEPVLEVEKLGYSFKRTRALCDLNLTVLRGSIHGFVGPNGAGKTTTLKIAATLLEPQAGNVRVFGHDVRREYKTVRTLIGFMPDTLGMYRQMTVFEYLDFFAAAHGLSHEKRDAVIRDVLELTDMAGRREDLIQTLSRGMQQRVSLARVLVHDPELLLLDEPASGLDPRARIELIEILKELQKLGKTVFISSHILTELADLCDDVTIIDRGTARYSGPIRHLLSGPGGALRQYLLRLEALHEPSEKALQGMAGVEAVVRDDRGPVYRIAFRRDAVSVNDILRAVLECGGRVVALEESRRNLNQAFMDLTEPGVRP